MSLSSNIRAGAAYVEVTAETSKLQRNLKTAQGDLQSFGRACTGIGKDLLMLSGSLALPLGLAVKGFAEFDDQMRLARAVTKATAAEFDSMTKVAQKLGRETSFTAKQVADGMVALGRMGFSPKEIEAAIQPTLDLARATGTELGEAADIAANSMRVFGLEASNMSSVADVLTATANGSAQTLTDLFEALKMAGPQAKAAGENIIDTNAAIGILANLGIKGSLAGTALRKSFSQFAKVKIQDQLKAVGVETVTASGDLRKMADIMADIGQVMASMPSAEKIAFAEDIFDIRGSLAGLSLGGNVKDLEAFIAKLQDIDGTARSTAKEMDAGLGGSFRMLMSAVEGAMNAVAKALEGTLQPLVDKLTAVTLAVISWIEANSGMVTGFAIAVAGAAGLGVALITIGVAAKAAAAGIAVVQTTLKAFTFLQGLCIAQGTTLGTSLSLIGQSFVNYRNFAIPALVGTEQLCAAFGIASSAANRTAASLVLMSNAEAAAAGKSMLVAKWNAVCTALKSFSLASVATTAATKAQTVAEATSALTTKILAGARAFAATVTGFFSVANLKAAATATAGGAANLFLALTTKAVAAGYMAATAAATAFCAIPVTWILIGIGAALAGVVIALSMAGRYTANLSDKMSELREKGDELRKTDKLRMERLQQLADKQKLTNAEMAEAKKLARDLQSKYGDLGISISDNAVQINALSTAAARLGAVELRVTNAEDLEKLRELKDLSLKVNLETGDQAKAADLIAELSEKYGDLGLAVDQTAGKIVALNDAAGRVQSMQMSVTDPDDLAKFDRMKDLSFKATLTVEEQGDAETLIAELSQRYGDLGVTLDRTSRKIIKLNSVAASLREVSIRVSGTEDLEKLRRLEQLSAMPTLDSSGIAEANTLIGELDGKYGNLGIAVDAANARVIALTDAQRQFASATQLIQAGDDPLKETHLAQLERLQKLAEQEKLTGEEQTEAQNIVNALNGAYGGLGLGIDTITGKLNLASDAQQKLNDKMKQATLAELDGEIAEMEANLKELQAEDEALLSYWNHNLWSQISGRQEEAVKKLEANGDRALAYRQKINAARKRKEAINEGDANAITGEDGVTTKENIEEEKQRRQQSSGAADEAAKKIAEIDKKLARERQTGLQNEIEDINTLRDEYKALIQTMLDYEKSKPDGQRDDVKIAELEGKLTEADKTAEDRVAKAQEKAAEKMKKEANELQRRFDETEKDIQIRREEQAQDRQLDDTLKTDKTAGIAMLQSMIEEYRAAAQAAKEQFRKELETAQTDGMIDDAERQRINDAQAGYSSAESMLDKYENKLRDAQDGTHKTAENLKPQGAFLAAALDGILGGSAADRTAKATEAIAANTKRTNDFLRKGSSVAFG